MKSCKAVSEMLGGRRQVNAEALLREVHAAEEAISRQFQRSNPARRHSNLPWGILFIYGVGLPYFSLTAFALPNLGTVTMNRLSY